jgi:RimJ/RimL family protein N-acetyltransferase
MLDAPDLLRWKNDPDTREFALVTHQEITSERHAVWMKWMLTSPDVRVYIIEANGKPCGDVRCEFYSRHIEMAIKLDRGFRGHGIGTYALNVIGDLVQKEFQKKLMAKIAYGNVASMRLFEGCGYRVYSHGEGYYIYSKDSIPTSK